MDVKNKITEFFSKAKAFFSSSRGKDILLYLGFVVISFVFWLMLALNNLMQNNYKVKFIIDDIPENITIVSEYSEELSVTVKNNGYAFVKYMFGKQPEIVVNFNDFADGKGSFSISKQTMSDLMVSRFGSGANIVAIQPDAMLLKYTNLPGKKVPVSPVADYSANIQYVVNGAIKTIPDSVTVFSDADNLNSINEVVAEKITGKNLTDSLVLKTAVKKTKDVKIIPDSVTVVIPVEPLVAKKTSIPIEVVNCPEKIRLIVFPSRVTAVYLLPLSLYEKRSDEKFDAIVDYNDIHGKSDKLPLRLRSVPENYRNIQLQMDSVEYIIEH